MRDIWDKKEDAEREAISEKIKQLWNNPGMSEEDVMEEYFTEALKNKTGVNTWHTSNGITMNDEEYSKLEPGLRKARENQNAEDQNS